MSTKIDPASPSKPLLWSSYILSGLAILFLIFDSAVKVIQSPLAVEPTTGLGYAANLVMIIGLIELACLILYAIPYTSVLGAVLLTGYLGGAVASNLRADMPTFNIIFPFIIAGLVWGGLYLREQRLRQLLPFRSNP